jgi:hypothetical protein
MFASNQTLTKFCETHQKDTLHLVARLKDAEIVFCVLCYVDKKKAAKGAKDGKKRPAVLQQMQPGN